MGNVSLNLEVAENIHSALRRLAAEDGLSVTDLATSVLGWYVNQRTLVESQPWVRKFDILGITYQREKAKKDAARKYRI